MDGSDTAMLVGLVALGVGVAIGWHLQVKGRQTRAAGAAPTDGGGKALAMKGQSSSGPNRFAKPIGPTGAGCGGCAS